MREQSSRYGPGMKLREGEQHCLFSLLVYQVLLFFFLGGIFVCLALFSFTGITITVAVF